MTDNREDDSSGGPGDRSIFRVRDLSLELVGEHAHGVLTSNISVRQQATAEVSNTLIATAPHARGHVDCKEIVVDQAVAHAVPIVEVRHEKAHVTHEAALGSVDGKQLETLMSRGLTEDRATDLIIEGLLAPQPTKTVEEK